MEIVQIIPNVSKFTKSVLERDQSVAYFRVTLNIIG